MSTRLSFHFCPICFAVSRHEDLCHEHEMVAVLLHPADDQQRRPLSDGEGRLLSHAPRWFLEATRPALRLAAD